MKSVVQNEAGWYTEIMKYFVLVGFLCFFLCMGACKEEQQSSKKGIEEIEEKAPVSETTKELTEKPKETMTMELVEDTSGESTHKEEEEPHRPLPGKEFLLVHQYEKTIAGEDMEIGVLHNVYTSEPETEDVFTAVDTFLEQLAQAEIAENVTHPAALEDVKHLLWYHFDRGNIPEGYRIGNITVDGGEGRADIRLLGPVGRASGEIYCLRYEGEWLIGDLQVDFAALQRQYEREGKYEPNVYRWIDQY